MNFFKKKKKKLKIPNGMYEGETKNGKPQGKGICKFDNGDKYIGKFFDGARDGEGTYQYENGKTYSGGWKNDKKDGKGKMNFGGKSEYEGGYKEGFRHGFGVFHYEKGDRFEGKFRQGKKDGSGTYYYSTVSKMERFVGEWKRGKKTGAGTTFFKNGDVFECLYNNDKKDGKGMMVRKSGGNVEEFWEDGDKIMTDVQRKKFEDGDYEGEILDDKRGGFGFMYYKDSGEMYRGEWISDVRQGKGTLFDEHERVVYSGDWENNQIVGKGIYYYHKIHKGMKGELYNGCRYGSREIVLKYEGDWKSGKKEGKGSLSFMFSSNYTCYTPIHSRKNSSKSGISSIPKSSLWLLLYEGDWKNEKQNGFGKRFSRFSSQNKEGWYEGEWKDNKRHGHGEVHFETGEIYKGEFRDDQFHGKGKRIYKDGTQKDEEWIRGVKKVRKVRVNYSNMSPNPFGKLSLEDRSLLGPGRPTTSPLYPRPRPQPRRVEQKWLYFNNSKYYGETLKERKHGRGVTYYNNGKEHSGIYVNGEKHGKGVETNRMSGRDLRFEGEFKNNFRWKGTFEKKGFGRFEGEFHNGTFGKGVMCYSSNNSDLLTFKGEYRKGKIWKGVLEKKSGHCYEGEFMKDVLQGNGILTDKKNGSKYTGNFENGLRNGKGIERNINGSIYDGEWKKGIRYGLGSYFWPNGNTFVGEWDNVRNGKGTLTMADGFRSIGDWKNDLMTGSTTQFNKRGEKTFEGLVVDGVAVGQGTKFYDNGDKYEGNWENNKRNGRGVCLESSSGDKYDGYWKDDLKHGKGVLIKRNGERVHQQWDMGMIEEGVFKDRKERIKDYLNKYDEEEDQYSNPSKLFRKDFFVGLNQRIDQIIFFDSGRIKEFQEYTFRKNEVVDAIFDTTVSDPKNDEILKSFLDDTKRKYKMIIPKNERNREEYEEKMKSKSLQLISEVISFYGGLDNDISIFNEKCEEVIIQAKKSNQSNLIYLGDVKGCGLCRHRSILFKLLCDIFGIPCRILRGWLDQEGKSYAHMWNEIVISKQGISVDCMNFSTFVPHRIVSNHYRNLGHPQKRLEEQRLTIENIRRLYDENKLERGKHLGRGAFGEVYEIRNVNVITTYKDENNYETKRMDIAIKEVNITKLTRYTNTDKKDRAIRIVKREVERMVLLQHPNIVQVVGSFSSVSKSGKRKIIRVVMKKYGFNGEQFLEFLEESPLPQEKQNTEVLIFLSEVAKGLKYIHSFGIVHFDIKPENILLDWNEQERVIENCVISDFGSSEEEKMNFMLTSSPTVTRSFAAPEILEAIDNKNLKNKINPKQVFTIRSDIYSYGVLMGAFSEYFEEFKNVSELQRSCLDQDPFKRPSLTEITFHLRASLAKYMKKVDAKYMQFKSEKKILLEIEEKEFEEEAIMFASEETVENKNDHVVENVEDEIDMEDMVGFSEFLVNLPKEEI